MIVFATHDASQRLRALYNSEIERKEPTESSYTENCAALIRLVVLFNSYICSMYLQGSVGHLNYVTSIKHFIRLSSFVKN